LSLKYIFYGVWPQTRENNPNSKLKRELECKIARRRSREPTCIVNKKHNLIYSCMITVTTQIIQYAYRIN